MVSHKKISEMLSLWGMQDEKITDVVFEENDETSETAKYVGDDYIILSNQFIVTAWFAGKDKFKSFFDVNVKMTNWIIRNWFPTEGSP